MPVYDFECQSCGHIQERVVPVSKCNRLIKCCKCEGKAKHIITMSGVHLGNDDTQGWIKSVLEAVVVKEVVAFFINF